MFAGAVTFCLAALSWMFVETPMLSLKRYATYRRGPARTAVASDEVSQHRSPVEL
jgi:peptidoglycan/LPS O-acetylase OafA/YrhL